ncbi:MAG TPA: LuxR C-terminal-related transcriptional regulator [Terriglobales bacterium]|nr:LuxR C-terminal-related transcriptional regulator [Terriglobales bacterium]
MLGNRTQGKGVPTAKESRVIELVARGFKNSEVAREIGTTEYVVKNYLRAIYDKLGLWNRVELALWYEARKHEASGNTPGQ